MWNAEFKPGTVPTTFPEVELRPDPDPRSPKENLEVIASILAAGVLRRRAREGASPSDVGRKAKNPQAQVGEGLAFRCEQSVRV